MVVITITGCVGWLIVAKWGRQNVLNGRCWWMRERDRLERMVECIPMIQDLLGLEAGREVGKSDVRSGRRTWNTELGW